MPKLYAKCIVALKHIQGEIAKDWYKLLDINAKFSASRVWLVVHNHRLKTR